MSYIALLTREFSYYNVYITMIDPVQLTLLAVIVILTILLLILGVQVFFILKDVRGTIKKTNGVLDNVDNITRNIEGPLETISSLVSGARSGSFLTVIKFINNFISREKDSEKRHHRE